MVVAYAFESARSAVAVTDDDDRPVGTGFCELVDQSLQEDVRLVWILACICDRLECHIGAWKKSCRRLEVGELERGRAIDRHSQCGHVRPYVVSVRASILGAVPRGRLA